MPQYLMCLPMVCCLLQAIVRMARAADKKGLRTIGVLTKADTIELGTHQTCEYCSR